MGPAMNCGQFQIELHACCVNLLNQSNLFNWNPQPNLFLHIFFGNPEDIFCNPDLKLNSSSGPIYSPVWVSCLVMREILNFKIFVKETIH